MPHAQIVAIVLIIHDIPSAQSSLVEAIHERLLAFIELIKPWNLVSNQLQIRKLFGLPNKAVGIGFARSARSLLGHSPIVCSGGFRSFRGSTSDDEESGCASRQKVISHGSSELLSRQVNQSLLHSLSPYL